LFPVRLSAATDKKEKKENKIIGNGRNVERILILMLSLENQTTMIPAIKPNIGSPNQYRTARLKKTMTAEKRL
jgi:hypothetical protein